MRRTEAVGAGVAPADDDDVEAGGEDLVGHRLAERRAVALREVLHGLVDAAELAARHRQVAGDGRADGQHDGVVAVDQLLPGDLVADEDAVAEPGSLGLHLREPAVQDATSPS